MKLLKTVKSAPFLEKLLQKDIEVLYLVDPIDEVAIQNLQTYKENKFVDISKEDLDLGDEDEVKERGRRLDIRKIFAIVAFLHHETMEPATGIMRIPPNSFTKRCVICGQVHVSSVTSVPPLIMLCVHQERCTGWKYVLSVL